MRRTFPAVAAALLVACSAPSAPPEDPTAAVDSMLRASADAWNRGDLDAFMSDYANEPTTGFVSGGRVQYGYDWIRSNYAPRFEPGARRDSLRFENLAARALGHDHALATARYVLFRSDSVTSSGPFTLVLRHSEAGWRIVHDQTGTDE